MVEQFEATVKKYMSQSGADAYIADVMAVRDLLAWTILSAFVIGFIYLILLRMIGSIIIYASIVAIILGTLAGGYMLFDTSNKMCEGTGTCAVKEAEMQKYYLYGAYAIWGFAGLIFICVCFNWKNIRIGIAVMKCTASFIGSTPQIFAVPPVAILLLMLWFGLWIVIALHIGSVGDV